MLKLMTATIMAASICGAVMLIQVGGWLQIAVAILLILGFFFDTITILALMADHVKMKTMAAKKTEDIIQELIEKEAHQ